MKKHLENKQAVKRQTQIKLLDTNPGSQTLGYAN